MRKKALLLLSGGIDSATLLAKLYDEKYETYALSFNYGQKHSVELDYAIQLGKDYALKEHIILDLPNESFISSALINKELKPNEFNTVDDLVSGFDSAFFVGSKATPKSDLLTIGLLIEDSTISTS